MQRRLATILAVYVARYSHHMEQSEARTLSALNRHRAEPIDPMIAECNGRIVKLMGDGLLAEFVSVNDTVKIGIRRQDTSQK